MADDRMQPLPPEGWARVAVTTYREFKADRIVAEQNFGGQMVRAVLHTVDRNVPVEPRHRLARQDGPGRAGLGALWLWPARALVARMSSSSVRVTRTLT